LVVLAQADLLTFWATLDPQDAVATSAALQVFMPELMNQYGDVAATVAANFFDDIREAANVKRAYRAVLSEPLPAEQIQASTRAVIQPLFGVSDPEQALSNLNDVTDRLVKQAGRNTVELNVAKDPVKARYARVPTGAKTCAFCLALASRGAVYLSKTSAAHGYHGDCDCVPTPMWDGDEYPEGYNPDELSDLYALAQGAADRGTLKGPDGILAAMRKQQGIA
jgi:hypothetical protein